MYSYVRVHPIQYIFVDKYKYENDEKHDITRNETNLQFVINLETMKKNWIFYTFRGNSNSP